MESPRQLYGLTVLDHCGCGGYGEVYRCRDASGKELALKVVSKLKVGSGWERELKGVTNYRKFAEGAPCLLKLYHVGEDEEAFYYTMELADAMRGCAGYKADTLAARLENGPLPQEELIPTLTAILECVRTLHQAGFAHRDIKPENILFINGSPKLADLGLLSPLTGTLTQFAGTLDFLPPEERTGESSGDSRESRQRNDLYAFGKIIYCCVTGNSASAYPSTPTNMPLTLANKLFFRLSMRLCDREPTRRLNLLSELLEEFQHTLHLIQHGETTGDRIRYAFRTVGRNLRSLMLRMAGFCHHRWCVALLMFCCLLAGGFWIGRIFASSQPPAPQDGQGESQAKAAENKSTPQDGQGESSAQTSTAGETPAQQTSTTDNNTAPDAGNGKDGKKESASADQQGADNALANDNNTASDAGKGEGGKKESASADQQGAGNALAKLKQLEFSSGTKASKQSFTFDDGRYTVVVPDEWQIVSQDTVADMLLPGDAMAHRLFALIYPKETTGNNNTVVTLMNLSITSKEFSAMDDARRTEVLGKLFNVENPFSRKFMNPRAKLENIQFIGVAQPDMVCFSYLFPREDHTLCMLALIPKEKYKTDTPKFLGIVDSLVWRR